VSGFLPNDMDNRSALLAEIAGYDSDRPVKQLFGSRRPRIRLVDTQFKSLEN
jgi:hypothetical protein